MPLLNRKDAIMDMTMRQDSKPLVEERLENLLHPLPVAFYRARMYGNYMYVMEYMDKKSDALLGFSPAESRVKNPIEKVMHPEDIGGMREAVRRGVDSHMPFEATYRLILPNAAKWVLDRCVVSYAQDGSPLYVDGMLIDLDKSGLWRTAAAGDAIPMAQGVSGSLGSMVGQSPGMRKVYDFILKAARSNANVIILGETGCGKDVAARTIHELSGRKGAYVPVNCGAFPENLLENEFFGHARGAFTGAVSASEGLLGAAHEGTLFMDEIGELPPALQVKFLRVLENRIYTPLGSSAPRKSDFRLIAATNRNLEELVREKKMREDFYYRVNVLAITIPPLRERKEDIPLLVAAWENRNGVRLELPADVALAMRSHQWPGNVRELNNFLDRYCVLGPEIVESLGKSLAGSRPMSGNLELATREFEREMIVNVLRQCHWHRGRAAEILGINPRTFRRRMKALGIGKNS